MGFFRQCRTHKSYDLFSAYSHYKPGIGGMFMLLLMLLGGAILGNIVIMVLGFAVPGNFASDYGMLISYPLMFIPAMIYASFQSRLNEISVEAVPIDSGNFGTAGKGIAAAVAVSAATVAASVLCDPLTLALPEMPESLKAVLDNMMTGMPLWASLLSVSVFAPFFEEWLYRGMVLRGLLGRMKPVWAITVSALFFAVIHFNPWQALPAFVLGMLFGYVYYRTGSLKLTMLMHCVNNTFAVATSQMDSFKDYNSFFEVMPLTSYVCLLAGCAVILAAFLILFKSRYTTAWQNR
ncbi:MAG: CPBP family intramembrane metalloprotease [Bacteroidales bacterium]|nr:CPBP family intramembrane metalloprotease [Bacteroidales bacterium]